MERKESYRNYLPHFQQPGQAYFVTWGLKSAVPSKALLSYMQKMQMFKSQIELHKLEKAEKSLIQKLEQEYNDLQRKYIKAYNDLLDAERNPLINLSKPENTAIIIESLKYWEGIKLNNCAFTIMSNHIHWVFEVLEKDKEGNPVYLQDKIHIE